jgi:hypothetical protein
MATNTYSTLPDKEDEKKKPKLKLSQIFQGIKRQVKGLKKIVKKKIKKNK